MIGLGSIANRFARVLNTCADAKLSAVAARSLERAETFAQKYGAERAYGSYRELMEDPAVQVIYIALTHNFHYEVAKECILHGKAVLCEKPFFLTRREAEEVFALAKEKQVLAMEAMWTRCLPGTQKVLSWVRDGRIGKVRFLEAQFSFYSPYSLEHRVYNPALAGGALYDAGVYPLEYATGILGETPVELQSMHTETPEGVDDFDVITARFASGALASLVCGVNVNTPPDAGIYGSDGQILVRNFLRGQECLLYDNDGVLLDSYTEPEEDGFIYQIRHIIGLYREKKLESPYIPWHDTIECAGLFDQLMADWHAEK